MASSSKLLSVPGRTNPRHDSRPFSSEHIYPDAPPSYDDIFPTHSESGPSQIPGDHKIQHRDGSPALHDWHSDSSVPSFHSRAEHSDSDSADSAEDSDADSILAQALEFASHPVPSGALSTRLRQPIAIPQVINGIGQPFARAYSPQLAAHGISVGEFVEFLDNLNIVSAGSPPLQVLDLAGGIVGMIPYHDAMAVGMGIQALAKIGVAVVSKVRGTQYMKKANERFFAPRGLRVELVTGEALRTKLGLALDAPLSVPMEVAGGMSVHERRVAALRGHASDDLTFDVPPPNAPSNVLDKMSAAQQKMQLAKQEKKALKSREKYHQRQERHGGDLEKAQRDLDRGVRKLEEKMAKADLKKERKTEKILNKGDRRMEHKLERLERKHARKTARIDRDLVREHKDYSRDQGKHDRTLRKGDREVRAGEKVLWVYIDQL